MLKELSIVVVVGCIVFLAGYPAYQHEAARWNVAFLTCTTSFLRNERILETPMCANPRERQLYGEKAEKMCGKAEHENQSSPYRCAWSVFWVESEIARLYHSITSNHWLLLGFGISVLFALIYILVHGNFGGGKHRAQFHSPMQYHDDVLVQQQQNFFSMLQGMWMAQQLGSPSLPTIEYDSSSSEDDEEDQHQHIEIMVPKSKIQTYTPPKRRKRRHVFKHNHRNYRQI